MTSSEVNTIFSMVESGLTSLAIVIGAIWTYFHYFRGRMYFPRLEPSVSMKITEDNSHYILIVDCFVKNSGLGRVDLELDSSGVEISEIVKPTHMEDAFTANENELAAFDIFLNHYWVEASEDINDEIIISIPKNDQIGFRARLRIVGKRHGFGARNSEWNAIDTELVAPTAKVQNEHLAVCN